MLKYLFKRIMSLIPVVIIISVLLFGLVKTMPGDPVYALMPPEINDPAEYERIYAEIKTSLGLDKSLAEQYVLWIGRTLSGDLGQSTLFSRPVVDVIKTPMKNTVLLNIVSTLLSFIISIIVGIKSAVKRGKLYDKSWQVFSLVGMSLPTMLISILLIYVFSIKLGWFPIGGMPSVPDDGSLGYYAVFSRYLVLPIVTLTIGSFASTIRYVRNAMIDVLNSDYIRTARAKGLVTVVAGSFAGIFGGASITEKIFSFNGIGTVLINSVTNRDYYLILALNLFYAVLSLVSNVIMDICYALVDPRVKLD